MTRLQKKCLVAAASAHLLVVVVLLCSGFVTARTKPDESQLLTMIPQNIIDAAFRSGVREAQPPAPAQQPAPQPVVQPPQPPPVQPQPQPQPQVQPQPQPKPAPPVRHVEPTPPPEPKDPDLTQPVERPQPKPPKHQINVDLNKKVVRKVPEKPDNSAALAAAAKAERQAKEAERAEKAAQRARNARLNALRSAATAIKSSTSSSTEVEMPGDSTQAYADYASVVKTVYTDAWRLPDDAANDEANVRVSVTIARDGRVTDAHILEKSGDPSLDNSVQRTLDRVHVIEPFPDSATDRERTYIINFNLKAKRQQLG